MNVLLDECVPRIIKQRLPTLNISATQEKGWAGLKNGALLTLAEAQFDVFVTTDKNLRHQQNLKGRKLAVILLPSNQVPIVAALIPNIEAALTSIQVGDFVALSLPSN